VVNALASGASP